MKTAAQKISFPLSIAVILWFLMFSPWTSSHLNFWLTMSFAAVSLTSLAIVFSPEEERKSLIGVKGLSGTELIKQILTGLVLAGILWFVFWVGDKISQMLFGFARPQVDSVYAMKEGLPSWLIALLLLLVIGPAEEIFWRGFIQRNAAGFFKKGAGDKAFLFTIAFYTFVHLWSCNFMLIMAAMVAGCVWGFLYRLRPDMLPALIVSHAVWDALVFIVFPI